MTGAGTRPETDLSQQGAAAGQRRPAATAVDAESQAVARLAAQQLKRARSLFAESPGAAAADVGIETAKRRCKARDVYCVHGSEDEPQTHPRMAAGGLKAIAGPGAGTRALVLPSPSGGDGAVVAGSRAAAEDAKRRDRSSKKDQLQVLPVSGRELRQMHERRQPKPRWHAPWKLHKVISGHLGWVRAVAVDWSNEWFASTGADRTIKIWDLATGRLRLTLTGHVSAIRGLCISQRSPYLFTCGEDGMVRCWDLETNKAVRNYHGHLNGVYCCALHPTLDILASGGRDAAVRVWDVRTRAQVHCMTGHSSTVASLAMQATEPQIISGSHDNMIRLWDIVAGRTRVTLTHHKKSIRALAIHPSENAFVSGAPDMVKKWRCPDGEFVDNFEGHDAVINAVACNDDGVVATAADNGGLHFWDWKSCHRFQEMQTIPQPGSLASEAGIFAATFDHSGTRLITGEVDKSIKIWREDPEATPETHPLQWQPKK
eukprot:TRINITY_DN2017_c1_g1_i1.p1 TRINITY_DN2017_c1_g1~~TRINITY_DN2017_c1_g1_i1.p1  ORF type:complete len:511 (+),score=103.01 TRINITY_DN2017_c1_g1_i1:74-1534(+)